jgi:hypothetical protein
MKFQSLEEAYTTGTPSEYRQYLQEHQSQTDQLLNEETEEPVFEDFTGLPADDLLSFHQNTLLHSQHVYNQYITMGLREFQQFARDYDPNGDTPPIDQEALTEVNTQVQYTAYNCQNLSDVVEQHRQDKTQPPPGSPSSSINFGFDGDNESLLEHDDGQDEVTDDAKTKEQWNDQVAESAKTKDTLFGSTPEIEMEKALQNQSLSFPPSEFRDAIVFNNLRGFYNGNAWSAEHILTEIQEGIFKIAHPKHFLHPWLISTDKTKSNSHHPIVHGFVNFPFTNHWPEQVHYFCNDRPPHSNAITKGFHFLIRDPLVEKMKAYRNSIATKYERSCTVPDRDKSILSKMKLSHIGEPLNINSPAQLPMLLRIYSKLGLNIYPFQGMSKIQGSQRICEDGRYQFIGYRPKKKLLDLKDGVFVFLHDRVSDFLDSQIIRIVSILIPAQKKISPTISDIYRIAFHPTRYLPIHEPIMSLCGNYMEDLRVAFPQLPPLIGHSSRNHYTAQETISVHNTETNFSIERSIIFATCYPSDTTFKANDHPSIINTCQALQKHLITFYSEQSLGIPDLVPKLCNPGTLTCIRLVLQLYAHLIHRKIVLFLLSEQANQPPVVQVTVPSDHKQLDWPYILIGYHCVEGNCHPIRFRPGILGSKIWEKTPRHGLSNLFPGFLSKEQTFQSLQQLPLEPEIKFRTDCDSLTLLHHQLLELTQAYNSPECSVSIYCTLCPIKKQNLSSRVYIYYYYNPQAKRDNFISFRNQPGYQLTSCPIFSLPSLFIGHYHVGNQ